MGRLWKLKKEKYEELRKGNERGEDGKSGNKMKGKPI